MYLCMYVCTVQTCSGNLFVLSCQLHRKLFLNGTAKTEINFVYTKENVLTFIPALSNQNTRAFDGVVLYFIAIVLSLNILIYVCTPVESECLCASNSALSECKGS